MKVLFDFQFTWNLKYANVTIHSDDKCANYATLQMTYNPETMICAGKEGVNQNEVSHHARI